MKSNLLLIMQPAQGHGRHPSDGELCEAMRAEEPEAHVIDHLVDCNLCQRRLQELLDKAEGGRRCDHAQ